MQSFPVPVKIAERDNQMSYVEGDFIIQLIVRYNYYKLKKIILRAYKLID